jgi:multidrug efflux pump subunit AcrA (membrane-fusion protein)
LVLILITGCAGASSAPQAESAANDPPATVSVDRGDVEQTVSAPGTLVGTRKVTLALGASGRLAELNVRPGDHVTAGETLAALDTAELQLKVEQAELAYLQQQLTYSRTVQPDAGEVAAAQAALSSANAAYLAAQQRYAHRDDQVASSCVGLENAKVALEQAQREFDAVANDWKAKTYAIYDQRKEALAQTQQAYDLALASCNLATIDLDDTGVRSAYQQLLEAKTALGDLVTPPEAEVAAAQADVELARLALEAARQQLANARLIAPFDGVVIDVKAKVGENVAADAGVIVLIDPGAVEVEAQVIEEDLPLVAEGQAATLFFDARPEVEASGKVARIVPKRLASDRPEYPVYLSLDDLPDGLAPGMTVDASIVIDQRENVLRLPRAVARTGAAGTAQVQVWTGGGVEERMVKVGLRGDRYVEILEGLSEGEQVVSE